MNATDFLIYDTVRSARLMVNTVSRGFTRHTGGFISFDNAVAFVEKMHRLYGVLDDPSAQRKRRRHYQARAKLFMGLDGSAENRRLWWHLLVSDEGGGLITERETLHSARDKHHLITLMGMEVVHTPRTEQLPSWTLRLNPKQFKALRAEGIKLARHDSPRQAQALIDREMRRPGLRGIRAQRAKLFQAMEQARHKLVARGREPLRIPKKQPKLRMINKGEPIPLGVLVRAKR